MAILTLEIKNFKKTSYYDGYTFEIPNFHFGNNISRKIEFLDENKNILTTANLNFFTKFAATNLYDDFYKRLPILRNNTTISFTKSNFNVDYLVINNQCKIKFIRFEQTDDMIEQSKLALEKITEYRNKKKENKPKAKSKFLDMFGQEINIGDNVIIPNTSSVGLIMSSVIGFTNVMVRVEYHSWDKLIDANTCFKLPDNSEQLSELNTKLVLKKLKK